MFLKIACSQKQEGYIKVVSPEEFNQALKGKHGVLLDVRTPGEFRKGHIPGAINIDFLDDSFSDRIDSLNKGIEYEVYCHSGGRSGEATELMQKKGFKKLLDLKGGFSKWQAQGFPVTK
jgi:rhodanese-related sulfurtransferase